MSDPRIEQVACMIAGYSAAYGTVVTEGDRATAARIHALYTARPVLTEAEARRLINGVLLDPSWAQRVYADAYDRLLSALTGQDSNASKEGSE